MTSYAVRAVAWEDGWELHVDGVGVTQCRVLDKADQQVRDFLATWLGHDMDGAEISVVVDLGDRIDEQIVQARALAERAQRETREAAAASRAIARRLRARGLSVADTAYVLRISRGRVSQLVR